tara:strand:+ start:29791 stop:31104 length:1314 start_codon:yes stop_codon:yes gene_type:complete
MADNIANLGFGRAASGSDALRRQGTTGGVAGENKLWLPVWSGEVLAAYDSYRVFEPLVTAKTISTGRVMEFPITGTVDLKAAWGAGEELEGSTTAYGSDTIGVRLDNRPIAAHFEVDNIDMMISQWEYRSELARQAGLALANARDKQILATLVRAAAEDATFASTSTAGSKSTGSISGTIFTDTSFASLGNFNGSSSAAERTDAALLLLQKIEEFHVFLQENDILAEGTYCAVTPQAFADIRALGVARDNSALLGGAGRPMFGGVADAGGLGNGLEDGYNALADTLNYMGMTIVKSNHLKQLFSSNVNTLDGGQKGQLGSGSNYADGQIAAIGDDKYSAGYKRAGCQAIMWKPESVAALSLQGMKVDTVEDVRRNTNFTVASMMGGSGVIRPECAALCISVASTIRGTGSNGLMANTHLSLAPEFVQTAGASGYPFG